MADPARNTTWIKARIGMYEFEQGVDFTTFHKIVERSEHVRGSSTATEYHLSMDMAKELSMVERTAKGRQARKYFQNRSVTG